MDVIIKIDGKSFHCEDCRCNVFHKNKDGKYVCNGCGATYTGEPIVSKEEA